MSLDRTETGRCLVFDQIEWHVLLRDGSVVVVHADGFSEGTDKYTFVVLVRGTPNFEQAVVTFPHDAVVDVFNP